MTPVPAGDLQAVPDPRAPSSATLLQAGLSAVDAQAWLKAVPAAGPDWTHDRAPFTSFWAASQALLDRLPARPRRSAAEHAAADLLLATARLSRENFLRAHVRPVVDALTDGGRSLRRAEDLVADASRTFPGLVPSAALLAREAPCTQGDKDAHEIDQGIFLAHLLADAACGMRLCHAMLLPHPDAEAALREFQRDGQADFGTVTLERDDGSVIANLRNPKYLNAEDDTTVRLQELAVDVCTLDAQSQVAVLRGARMTSGKYAGKRVYCTGINLTHLYHGKVPYLWYIVREMGWLNKVFRGVAWPDRSPDEVLGETREKLWMSAVDAFAIGGGCQYLLVMDVNIAASDAYMTLPARKEGIVPGAANLRLPRFVGDRVARQAVMMERRIDCDSTEGRMICDRIVAPGATEAAVSDLVSAITRSGVVSAASNRKAFRVAHEPLDLFRRYMAVYAREQAYCHFSPALIRNLEQFWNAQNRRAD